MISRANNRDLKAFSAPSLWAQVTIHQGLTTQLSLLRQCVQLSFHFGDLFSAADPGAAKPPPPTQHAKKDQKLLCFQWKAPYWCGLIIKYLRISCCLFWHSAILSDMCSGTRRHMQTYATQVDIYWNMQICSACILTFRLTPRFWQLSTKNLAQLLSLFDKTLRHPLWRHSHIDAGNKF